MDKTNFFRRLFHHKCLELFKHFFENLLNIKSISFRIIGTTSMENIFIKLRRLSILGGLFNGGHIVLLSLFLFSFFQIDEIYDITQTDKINFTWWPP
jgi:hypothetical protein